MSQGAPHKAAGCAYSRDMKTIQHLDMSSFMEAYKAKVHAEHARAEAVRKGEAKPQPSTVWNISDTH